LAWRVRFLRFQAVAPQFSKNVAPDACDSCKNNGFCKLNFGGFPGAREGCFALGSFTLDSCGGFACRWLGHAPHAARNRLEARFP
jgi:hypothetical protein